MKATFKKHTLIFKRPSGTSRGVLKTKDTYFILIKDEVNKGVGECGLLRGLSIDDRPDYEEKLQWVCDNIHLGEKKILKELEEFPSIQIGVETAFLSLVSKDMFSIFPSDFSLGNAPIEINGLIWMGDAAFMKSQISEKLEQGFNCIKMKIGAIDFNTEISVLEDIRKHFSKNQIELRVDANGAFKISEALEKLKTLSALDIHSIEQPIKQGNWIDMAKLCEQTPLPIALDEELIGIFKISEKRKLLEIINPQYIILKPSFVGGFAGTDEWISLADSLGIGWWITSALESNIGLNAISQYTFTKNSNLPQGLGTGSLYTNNVPSPLTVENGTIFYDTTKNWDFNF
ncbi:o-succinylbenzoate synthase [Patiriisocius marinus]|uniref:O-succinylbenzoate synthase n=1 Tax=Patiriisocius marinus TaxID=1397112 RepID=A0A5J4J6W7_9FLAO|nr:o-succinylbenzoate synthase [Patiriisocius marinus]GER60247.1 o-succinylbenzoate synthase [Patiriisocius marinus]